MQTHLYVDSARSMLSHDRAESATAKAVKDNAGITENSSTGNVETSIDYSLALTE